MIKNIKGEGYFISAPLAFILIAFVSLLSGLLGIGAAAATWDTHNCKAGQVYVVDTDRCVAGTDHTAHNE